MSNETIRAELVKVLRQLASELGDDAVLDLLSEATAPAPRTKVCQMCERELPITDFYTHPKSPDGLDNRCKPCIMEYNRKISVAHVKQARQIIANMISGYDGQDPYRYTARIIIELDRAGLIIIESEDS